MDEKMDNSICEECKLNPCKYKCPGCSIRTCGLACVKSHKQRTGCTGKRKLEFVSISRFDDNLLLSDYNMLEDTKRVAESAQRLRKKLCKYSYFQMSDALRSLQIAARCRKTEILFLPGGMLKREKNQSKYNNKSKRISWTIEWRFHSTDVVLVDHRVGEDTSLCSVLENHLKPGPWIHKLKPFCDVELDSLKLLIRKYPKGAKAPFKELNIKAPLRQQLARVVVLEYPVIHVYLPSQSCDFEVIRDFNHVDTTTPNPNGSFYDSTEGITFRDEVMEEDDMDAFEPKVVDLIKQMNYNPSQRKSDGSKVEGDNSHPAGNMELEFDQGLLDTYAQLFADMDPGDYFNFECEFAKGFDSDDNCNLQNLATDINDDGLEEGEIIE